MQTFADRRQRIATPDPVSGLRSALLIALQGTVLWLINLGASAVVTWLHVPVPGSVLGLAVLFAALWSGAARVSWFEPAATVLVKHLAFFFIPVTVGVLDMGSLFARHGAGIVLILAVSASVGIGLSGLTSQSLMRRQNAAAAIHRAMEPSV